MVRMISVADEVYERLKNRKGEKSFSSLLNELLEEKNQKILRFAGALKKEWKTLNAEQWIDSTRNGDRTADKKRFGELARRWKE